MCCVLGPPRMSPAPLSSSPASTQPPLQGQAVDWTRIQMVGGGPHPIFGKQRFDEERCQQQQPAGGTCACCGVAASTPGVTLKKCSRCKAVACELVWVAVARLLDCCGECSPPVCATHRASPPGCLPCRLRGGMPGAALEALAQGGLCASLRARRRPPRPRADFGKIACIADWFRSAVP